MEDAVLALDVGDLVELVLQHLRLGYRRVGVALVRQQLVVLVFELQATILDYDK